MSLGREEVEAAFAASPLYQEIHRLEREAEDLPQAGAKRQHFNPQFLLRRFLDEGRARLCQLHTTSGKPQAILPQDAASRRWFYTLIDESGERDNRAETYLALVDGHAAEALRGSWKNLRRSRLEIARRSPTFSPFSGHGRRMGSSASQAELMWSTSS